MANQIKFNVGYTVDKTGLSEIQSSLQTIQKLTTSDLMNLNKGMDLNTANRQLSQIKQTATEVGNALKRSFNSDLGTLNISKFNNELKSLNIDRIYKDFSSAGVAGQSAFRNITSQILTTNMQLKQTHSLLDNMAITMSNTIKWGVASGIMNRMTGSIEEAWGYTKRLDSSLNDIMIVTGKSADEMNRFAEQANKAAKDLAAGTTDYTNAALIYYQQGLSDQEVAARAEVTLKAANVTGQDTAEVSEQLTAVWNGYKVQASEAELYVDKLAAVAATTASDLEELSVGMSKVASAASIMGVDIDQLNATLATVVSVTRQAPESVGTAFKTIYARMGDIEAGLDTETTLGAYTKAMKEIADVNVLDTNNQLRDMGDVIEEVGNNWNNLSREQQIALSQVMAGTRQYNNLLSLFDNWDMYTEALETSADAAGTLQNQQDIYMESTAAHLEQMSTAFEDLYDSLLDTGTINDIVDIIGGAASAIATFVDAIGGGGNALLMLGSIGTNVFSKQIAQSLATTIINFKAVKDNARQVSAEMQILEQFKGSNIADGYLQNLVQMKQSVLDLGQTVTKEQQEEANAIIRTTNELQNQQIEWQDTLRQASEYMNSHTDLGEIDFSEGFGDRVDDLEELRNALNRIDTQIENTTTDLERWNNELEEANIAAAAASNDASVDNIEAESAAYRELSTSLNQAEMEMNELIQDQATTAEQRRILVQGIREYNQAITDGADLTDAGEILLNAYSRVNNSMRTDAQNTRRVIEREADGASQNIANNINTVEQQWTRFINNIKLVNQIQQVVKFASSLGQITSALNSIHNIVDIINNEDLTAGEKILQVISAIAMALPMLLTGITGIGSSLVGLATSLGLVTAGEVSAATAAGTLGVTLWTALAPILPIILAVVGAIAAVTTVVVLAVKAWNADANAAKEAAEASKEAAKAATEAKEAYQELADTFGAYDEAVEKLKELTIGTEEYADALKAANEKAVELINSNADLAKYAYRNSEGLIQFGKTDDEKTEVEALIKAAEARAQIASGASSIAQIDANNAQLKSDRTDTIRNEELGYWSYDAEGYAYWMQMSNNQLAQLIDLMNANDGSLVGLDEEVAEILNGNQELIDSIYDSEGQLKEEIIALAESTEALNATNKLLLGDALRDSLGTDEDYAALGTSEQNAIAELYGEGVTEDDLASLREGIHDDLYQDAAFGGGNEDDIHSAYAKARGWTVVDDKWGDKAVYADSEGNEKTVSDDVARAYLEQIQFTEELKNANEELLNTIITAVPKIAEAGTEISDVLGSEILGFATGKDTSFDANQMSLSDFSALQQAIDSGELESALSKVTDAEWAALNTNLEDFTSSIDEALNEELYNEIYERTKGQILGLGDEFKTLLDSIQSGDLTSSNIGESEEFQAISAELENIKDFFPEATAAAEVFSNTNLVGTQLWIEALDELKNKLNHLELQELADSFEESFTEAFGEDGLTGEDGLEVDAWLNSDEFEEQLDKILDADYAINLEIHTQAEEAFEDATAAMANIEEQASKIGDDFIVAAEDVRELNNAFPGILNNVTDLKNGTIQLNQETVESAMAAAQTEVAADVEATNVKLQNAANELRAKQMNYQAMANAAAALATATDTMDEESANNKAIIQDGLNTMREESNNAELDDQQLITDNSNTNAGIMASNWAQAYQSAAQSAAQFAAAAVQAAQVAAAGEGSVDIGDFGVNYTGASGVSAEATQLDAYQGLLDSGTQTDYAKLAEAFQNAADAAGQQANDIEGMMYEMNSSLGGITSGLEGVKNGLGSDGKDDDGGSSSKEKDPDYIEQLEDEIDRYHDINIELEQISTNLSRLEKEEKKLFGKELLDNLNEQLEVLKQQNEAYETKLALAKQEAAEIRGMLSGIDFNDDGTIANYAAALQAKQAYVNSLINQYNAMSAEEQESFKAVVDAAKEDYEEFKSQIERYDDLISSEIPDLEDNIQDALDKEIEIQIKKFTMEVEIRLDMAEAEKDFNEFKHKVIDGIKDDDILGNAKADLKDLESYFNTNDTGIGPVQALTNQVEKTLEELAEMENGGTSDVYGDNKAQALEDLKTYYTELMGQLEEVEELSDQIKESYLDMIDEAIEEFDKQVDQYEYINDLINHDMNLIGLLYGEDAYAEMDKYYRQMEANNNKELDFLKKRVAYAYEMMQAETDPEAKEKWQQEWQDSLSELNSKVEDSVQNIIDMYSNSINKVFDELNDKITNGLGLDYINDEWDLINQNAEQYLDTVNSMYAIQDLENKYLEALDATDSIGAQQKLNDLMNEQLAALREKDKLTQYDVDRANMLYDIALKEIALQNAQQNKSKMRLRRDSQGNYSYQYVSDEDSIAQAQQELLAAQNDLYNLDKDQYKNNLDQIYSTYAEFQEKLKALYLDQTLTAEERAVKEAMLVEQYGELINGLVEQNETIRNNLQESTFQALAAMYEVDVSNFTNMSNAEQEILMENMIPTWDSSIQHMADTFAGEGGFIPTCTDAFEELRDTTADYQQSLDDLEAAAGVDFDSMASGYDENISKAEELLWANDDLIAKYQEQISAIQDVMNEVAELIAKYEEARAAAEAATEAAYAYWQAQQQAAAEEAANDDGGSGGGSGNNDSGGGSGNSGGGGSGGGSSGGSGDGTPKVGEYVTYTGGLYYYDSYGTSPTGSRGPGKKVKITSINNGAPYPIHVQSSDSAYGWLKLSQLSGYKTGGLADFTGPAWLDGTKANPELVLNATDTENLLAAVGLIRDMESLLTTLNQSTVNRMTGLLNMPSLFGGISRNSDTLEQNVHIDASFPNVRDSREIEEAFNNLVNIASQRAFNTQR